ncbi:integral membrane protein PTH11 [Fusarium pseudoanthophilum]|uniref:Integral membrane protein PTH11 n=1 Tax=Fusarium pseudoanthophilum TaxID=48495 RepID=A0A8H5KSW5_9HYPO|nr:integral membrane protein PTH11 [Fusarium pseudoanthophilum]
MTALAGQIAEIWILYVIGTAMIGARIFCRTKMVGYRNYDWDDYLVIAVAGMWTAAPVIGQVFVQGAEGRHTSDLTFEERKNMSEEDSKKWAYGSQMFLLGLTGYVVILWTLKFNMLCFYSRVWWLSSLRWPRRVDRSITFGKFGQIQDVSIEALDFLNGLLTWTGQCVPQNLTFFVVILVFNLVTDICIMLIPIPVLVGIQTNRLKKFGLFLLFSLGFFCMFAAILRFVLIFNASPGPQSPTIAFTNTSQLNQKGVSALWSMREDCVGIFVGQAPMVTPLLKRRFWVMAGYATDKTGNSQTPHYNGSRLESHELRSGRANNSKVHDPYSITNVVSRSESQEEIVQKDLPSLPEEPRQFRSGIRVEQRIDVEAVQGTYTPPRDPRW